ncbi:MAG: PilZ domain-containing protein [Candidatus Omnitrophica bacterium]|nr:PilZ domain-containing protein [Candidatus Omnitrophota bacterium]
MEKERRRFKRFDAYMSVKFAAPGNTQAQGMSLSKDLSREGIKINSNFDLEEGALIDLEIDIPEDPKPVKTSGKIMWSRPAEGKNQGYDQGVRFMMMDPVDKFRVLDYAYNHWLETKVNDFDTDEDEGIDLK